MKNLLSAIAISLFIVFSVHAQQTVKLLITYKDGPGPFIAGFGGLGWDSTDATNSWYKTYLPVKGIPADWTDVKKGMICFDSKQFVYQNYIAGNISINFYKSLQKSWNWIPDTTKLSERPLQCYVYVASGKNAKGQLMLIVDTQNNLDFSDDVPFIPDSTTWSFPANKPIANLHYIKHQHWIKGRITDDVTPVSLCYEHNMVMFNIPQHAITTFKSANGDIDINVSTGFVAEDPANASITLLKTSSGPIRITRFDSIINKDQYITINHKIYLNKGVDEDNMLNLQLVKDTDHLYSTQVGYRAIPFTGNDFATGKKVSLADYKGKYVLIDFWGIWCGPCRAQLPHLKDAYAAIDKNRIEFIGIVNDDTPETLKPVIDKEGITWPQIIADESNNIVSAYNIDSYPTTLLIDPQGKIVAKNLRGSYLMYKLKEVLK